MWHFNFSAIKAKRKKKNKWICKKFTTICHSCRCVLTIVPTLNSPLLNINSHIIFKNLYFFFFFSLSHIFSVSFNAWETKKKEKNESEKQKQKNKRREQKNVLAVNNSFVKINQEDMTNTETRWETRSKKTETINK